MENDSNDDPTLPEGDIDKVLASSEVQLAGFDPWATGRALGMSERAIKFGLALLTGATKTAAAKIAGFPGEKAVLRSAASKAARTRAMQAFLKAAEEHKAGVSDAPLTPEEKRRILARGARGSNPATQIRAVLADHQIEQELELERAEQYSDPKQTLLEIAAICPEVAARLAVQSGIPTDFLEGTETKKIADKYAEDIALNWIRDNPQRAKELTDFFAKDVPLRPITNGNPGTQWLNQFGMKVGR